MKLFFQASQRLSDAWYERARVRREKVLPRLSAWAQTAADTAVEPVPVSQGIWKLTLRLTTDRRPAIAQWVPRRKEYLACLALAAHLDGCGVRLPRILSRDDARCFLLLEDVGRTLSSLKRASRPPDAPVQAAIALADFHRLGTPGFRTAWSWRRNGRLGVISWLFDCAARLYPWMLAHGQHLPRGVFRTIHTELLAYARALDWTGQAQGLLHTDWQYENLLPGPQGLVVIDWQGAALGPLSLDLARLTMTNDPEVWQDREAIIDGYLNRLGQVLPPGFHRQLELMETGWMLRLFPLFADKPASRRRPLVADKLEAISRRESMRGFPALVEVLGQAAASLRTG